ncbi:MAG: cupin domain-containing protein [Dehalococcoidia bacterium]
MTLYRWDDVKKEQLSDTLVRRFVHGERGMVAQLWLSKGSRVPTHVHEAEQLTYVVDGHLRLWLGDPEKAFDVRSGEILVIPANVPHRAEAVVDTYDLDIFAPPRRDWIEGQDAYLRGR